MNAHLVHMKLNPGVTASEVERVLDELEDWYRYRGDAWIVVSDLDAAGLAHELERFYRPKGGAVIVAVDLTDADGWAGKEFWDWVSRHA